MKNFLTTNKVLLLGLLGAIGTILEQYVNETSPNYIVIAFAVGIGILSYLGNNLKGEVASIVGLLGTSLTTIATSVESGNKVGWPQVIGSLVIAIIAIIAPAPQPKPTPPPTK
jgi:hypothetical protein